MMRHMHNARIAQLLRALADEFDSRPIPVAEHPRRKHSRVLLPVPASMPSEIDMARAKEQLRKLGYRPTGVKR